jgi:hypothetical protein
VHPWGLSGNNDASTMTPNLNLHVTGKITASRGGAVTEDQRILFRALA